MLVLFDLDGTLLDDRAAVAAGVQALHATFSADRAYQEFVTAWQEALERSFEEFDAGHIDFYEQRRARVRDVIDPTLGDEAADEAFSVYLEAHESAWALYDDVIPCLDALKGHILGIVSNGIGSQQRAKLTHTAILDRFELVVISADVGIRKPDPAIFRLACRDRGTNPSDAMHVGDRYQADALGARSAGLAGVWLDRDESRDPSHEGPVVSTLTELVDMICPA